MTQKHPAIWGIVVFGLLAVLVGGIMAGITHTAEVDQASACKRISTDIQVLNQCEGARNCSYTYDTMHDLVHGYVACMQDTIPNE